MDGKGWSKLQKLHQSELGSQKHWSYFAIGEGVLCVVEASFECRCPITHPDIGKNKAEEQAINVRKDQQHHGGVRPLLRANRRLKLARKMITLI